MELLYPGFLYALAALAIPVIVHLFNFRRFKKIPFTNVRFLRDIKLQTQSQNKLRHLLILLMRLLAIAFLVLAFAQPFIPEGDVNTGSARRNVSIFVDNSFSMEGESSAGALIEVAKNRAIDIAMAFDPSDRFQLLSQDFEGKHQRLVSREVFVDLVQELELSPQSHSLEEIYSRQTDLLHNADNKSSGEAFIISDFQRSRYNPEMLRPDSSLKVSLVVLERSETDNLYIDSVWFDSPVRKLNDSEQLHVRVVNTGNENVEKLPVRLEVNGTQRAIGSVDVSGKGTAIANLEYLHEEPGIQQAVVSIQDSPVSYDDTWYFAYEVYQDINILGILPSLGVNDPLQRLFARDSVYRYTAVSARNVDYSTMATYRLVVLNGLEEIPSGLAAELRTFTENGGSVWLIPSAQAELASYNAFLNSFGLRSFAPLRQAEERVRTLNAEHPLYRDIFESIPRNVDLPQAKQYYPMALSASGDALMTLSGGNTFLSAYSVERGKLYILAAALDATHSNFSRHALFVATALRIAEMSQSTALLSITMHPEAYFSIPAENRLADGSLRLTNSTAGVDIIPTASLRDGQYLISPGPDVRKAGLYALKRNDDLLSAVGINYPREESDLASRSRSELQDALNEAGITAVKIFDGNDASLAREIALASSGRPLWKICLILALAFLLAEQLLIRFRKPLAA